MKKIFLILVLFIIGLPNIKAETIIDKISDLNKNSDNLSEEIAHLNDIDKLYPIGSIYITVSNINPSNNIGGIWESYSEGRQLVGVGNNGTSTYNYNDIGGSSTKTLLSENIPAHTHTTTPSGIVSNIFEGSSVNTNSTGAHTHEVEFNKASNEAKGFGLFLPTTTDSKDILYYGRVVVTSDTINGINTDSSNNHTHTLTPEGTVESTFKGEETTTSSVGATQSFSIQNPYTTVYMWKRIA